jgi:hypothetical protein
MGDEASVFNVMGSGTFWDAGAGVTYFNGKLFTNAVVILALSGFLPAHQDIMSLAELNFLANTNTSFFDPEKLRLRQSLSSRQISINEVTKPVRALAYAFGPNPLEDLVSYFGPNQVRMLQAADELEVIEIKSGQVGSSPAPGASSVEGYKMEAQGKTLGRESARQFAAALLTERNELPVMSDCSWQPVIVFRARRGKESASLIVCFECHEAEFRFYDATGNLIHKTQRFSFSARQTLLRLAQNALPDSRVLSGIKQ